MKTVLRDALRIFSDRGARFLGAAVAFYALLSAAPLFVVVLHAVAAVAGRARAESALWGGLAVWLDPEGLAAIREMTARLDHLQASGGVAGVVIVLYGSTRMFRAVRRALNILYGVDLESVERARPRTHRYLVRYGSALALTLLVVALVVALLAIKAAFALLGTYGAYGARAPAALWAVDALTSVVLAFALFTSLFRWMPETDVTWREAATAGAVSTFLFAAGSAVVSLYLRHKHLADLYAGAGAVVLAVMWVYYSAQVFFLGACVGAAMRKPAT